ncbi:MAG: glycosyltransferase family 4 protein [Marinilabiliaceae bacterium]|nr:glycosyltransferase family 4 protein [Marinilabiliaceae bacterium]
MKKKRLAIISTHSIQYNAPLFVLLAKEPDIELKVFYTWSQRQTDLFDEKFGKAIEWDIPLLDGYEYTFVENKAKNPGTSHFRGIHCPTLNKEIEDWKASHILVFGWNFQAHFKAMRYFKGRIPVMFRGDSTLLDYDIKSIKTLVSSIRKKTLKSQISNLKSFIKFQIRKAFLTYIYSYIDTALYVGQNNKAYFKCHGLTEDQLAFVPHAIDNDRFNDSPEKLYEQKATQWRSELGIKEQDITILFAGKFEPRKNPVILPIAFNLLEKNANPSMVNKIKLIMVGDGPLDEEIKFTAQNNPNVLFIPFQNQSQMPVLYRLGNIICLPSTTETWGLAVNEALACGRPVIVSDKVGCANNLALIPNRIFKAGDVEDLSHQLSLLIQQIEDNEITKESCQQQISEWSFEAIVKAIKRVLDQ